MSTEQWNIKNSLYHKSLPTTIASIKNIIIESDIDMQHHNILNCQTLNNFLVHKKINHPIIKGSLMSYDLNNEVYTNDIIVNTDNINLASKKITNCSEINHIKFNDKNIDFSNKRLSSIGNPKFLNDGINKGYLLEQLLVLQNQIDILKQEISILKLSLGT